jgi:beta-lactamase superfamily II metal-dependent hydrolase
MALYLGSSERLKMLSTNKTGSAQDPYFVYFIKNEALNSNSTLINAGLCVIIHGKQNILIDFGYDVNCTRIIEKCQELNIKYFDYAFITHYHSDHVTTDIESALSTLLLNGVNIKHFILPHRTIAWDRCTNVSWYREIKNHEQKCIDYLNANNIPYTWPEENEYINIGLNLQCQCFNIADFNEEYYGTAIEYNNFSAIYKFFINDYIFMVVSDATPTVQKHMAKKMSKCDILQVEHHGINRKGCKAWCDALKPAISIASVYDSKYYDLYLASSPNVVDYMKTSVFYTNIEEEVCVKIGNGLSCDGIPVAAVDLDSTSLVNISTYARNEIIKGVQFEASNDGFINASGTASGGNANFYAAQRLTVTEPTNVIFGGCPQDGSSDTYFVSLGSHTETSWNSVAHDYGTGATATLQPGVEYLLACRVKDGSTVNNVKFKPFISSLDFKANGYIRSLEYKIALLD